MDSQRGIFTENKPSNSPLPTEEEVMIMNSEEHPKTSPGIEENESEEKQDAENDQSGTTNQARKPLRKPDKILPCPRCNSMDTKFCYYNNYNVNQPRHFCKSCQRYWTAGGAMRNVPVGAGRRKSKNSASPCRHITISEAVQAARMDTLDGPHHPACRNGVVLSFQNGIYKAEGENGSDSSTGSSVTTNSSSFEGGRRNYQSGTDGSSPRVQCLQGLPWTYPSIPSPGFCPLGYPIPVYPIPYWNCSVPGTWPVPWLPPQPQSPVAASPLGKRLRNGELLGPNNLEKKGLEEPESEISILMPKTLRIDDPDEAAKSSIWATLGIKDDGIHGKAILKAFEPKGDEKKNYVPKTPSSLLANPAAIARSHEFQETA